MGRTREGTSWAAKAEGGRWGNVKKTGKLIPKYQVFKRLQRDQQGRQATWPKKPAADWLRDVGSGNTGLHWVNPCRPSSSYVGIAAGPSSRRSRKTRQLAEILAEVFAIAELFTLPIQYLKLASPVLFCLYLSKLALLVWCQLPI